MSYPTDLFYEIYVFNASFAQDVHKLALYKNEKADFFISHFAGVLGA